MTKDELIQKITKILDVGSDKFLLNGVYFNPLNAPEFAKIVPELKQAQFKFSKTETEDEHGTHVTTNVHGPNHAKLSLGSVLLDGASVIPQKTKETMENGTTVPQKAMATKDEFIDFFRDHLPDLIR
jgi:hypothetical protein